MMKSWLDEIREKAASMPQTCPFIEDKVAEGEKEIGVVPENARPYLTVAESLRDEAREAQNAHEAMHKRGEAHLETECMAHAVLMGDLMDRAKTLMKIFWIEIKHQIPEAASAEHGIGVRGDWKVVAIPEQKEDEESSIIPPGMAVLAMMAGGPSIRGRG